MDYLTELGLSNEEISKINPALVESLTLFPLVVKENFSTVRELKLTNEHDVFVICIITNSPNAKHLSENSYNHKNVRDTPLTD